MYKTICLGKYTMKELIYQKNIYIFLWAVTKSNWWIHSIRDKELLWEGTEAAFLWAYREGMYVCMYVCMYVFRVIDESIV